MKKRYTVTFSRQLQNIDEPLKELERMGVEVQSTQRFIGTAIVAADEQQVQRVRSLDLVEGITETGSFRAL